VQEAALSHCLKILCGVTVKTPRIPWKTFH